VIFDWRDGGISLPPHIVEDDERVVITAETEQEAQRAADARISRLRQRGQKFEPDPTVRREKSDKPVEAQMTVSLSSTIRAKVAAKIALGAFSLVLPEDWLDTGAARLLQSWLWDEAPKTADGEKIFAVPKRVPDPIDKFCCPPEHLLFFLPSTSADVKFGIALFGEELMVVNAGPLDGPAPEVAWRLDPIALTCEETTQTDLVLRARDAYLKDLSQSLD
jgi:hypothetical protein